MASHSEEPDISLTPDDIFLSLWKR